MDNDHYGHVNNVVYYSYFDTAVNGYLIDASGTDIRDLPAIGMVAETSCRFLCELTFPETVDAGLAVERLGNSSVIYRIGLFATRRPAGGAGPLRARLRRRRERRPVPVPEPIRAALTALTGARPRRQPRRPAPRASRTTRRLRPWRLIASAPLRTTSSTSPNLAMSAMNVLISASLAVSST